MLSLDFVRNDTSHEDARIPSITVGNVHDCLSCRLFSHLILLFLSVNPYR